MVVKRKKTKKDELPKDTLAIYNINKNLLTKIGNVKSYKSPEKWDGFIAYLLEEVKAVKKEGDTTKKEDDSSKTAKSKNPASAATKQIIKIIQLNRHFFERSFVLEFKKWLYLDICIFVCFIQKYQIFA